MTSRLVTLPTPRMDNASLLEIAAAWSYWDAPPPHTVERRIRMPTTLQTDLALVVQGVRRCGKSTLLSQLIGRYGLDRRRCLFVNFEDPRLSGALDHKILQGFVDAFEPTAASGPATYFFDEIQRVDGWQRWLRKELDRPRGRRFVVTGSNSSLLAGELATTLTGRHLRVELFPFDFDELRELRPGASVTDFLRDGGFPAAATSTDPDTLLRSYFNDVVERDVRERVGARSSRPLRQLVQMLYESAGSELSVRRLAGALELATDTTSLYLDAVESAYLAFPCPCFAWSTRKQSARKKKWYPIDNGLRRVSVVNAAADRGKQLECATFLLLRQRYREVCYWNAGGEVDFVVEQGGVPVPIQVSADAPQERHHRALDAFYREHPRSAEAVFVDVEAFAGGLPRLTGRDRA